MFTCPYCQASFKHNGVCLRKHIDACSLISSTSEVSNIPTKISCPNCSKKFVSQRTLDTHLRKFHSVHSVQLSEPLAEFDQSSDFFFDLIGDMFFDSSSNETANFDIDSSSSWLASLDNFTSSTNNKFNILHLNINSVWVLKSV